MDAGCRMFMRNNRLHIVIALLSVALAWLALGCASLTPTPTATPTPTPYPEATPAPDGHYIGNWQVFDVEEDGTGARLHGIGVDDGYTAGLAIRCNERLGLDLLVGYAAAFESYEELVLVGGVISGEERAGEWGMSPSQDALFGQMPEAFALWLHENADETLFHSAYPTGEPARFNRFELTGIDRALWQILPCDESKFVNFEP